MTTTLLKIKNGSIKLPKEVEKAWLGRDIYMSVSEDTILLKRMYQPTLTSMLPQLRKLGKLISKKDIDEAVRETRKKERN